jgi:hypothetical protein
MARCARLRHEATREQRPRHADPHRGRIRPAFSQKHVSKKQLSTSLQPGPGGKPQR